MISFIVDCFDPWERVHALLQCIYESEIEDDYEILLMSSLLLDTPQEIAECAGEKLFGERFSFIKNDSLSVFAARCRAQELAQGEIFFYLSPSILPEKETIATLISILKQNTNNIFAASSLSFAYHERGEKRMLAHGFAVAPTQKLTPLLLTAPMDAAACMCDYPVRFAPPFCFCSHGAFYIQSDKCKTFLGSHICACIRQGAGDVKGISIGKASSCMYSEAFPAYFKSLYEEMSNPINNILTDLSDLAFLAHGEVELTPYADFRVTNSAAIWPLPQEGDTSEHIFWSLLYWERPEFIAAASRSQCTDALKALAQICLWKIASTPWEHLRNYICEQQNMLKQQNKNYQVFIDWFSKYESIKDTLYTNNDTSLIKSIMKSKSFFISLTNCFYIIFSGLLGLKKLEKIL